MWRRVQSALERRPWLVLVGAAAISLPTIALGEIAAADARMRLRDAQLQSQSAAAIRAANRVSFILADVADKLYIETRPTTALAAAAASKDANAIRDAVREAASHATYTWAWAYFFVDPQGVIGSGWKTSASAGSLAQPIGQRGDLLPWADTPRSQVGARFMAPDVMARTFAGPELYLSDLFIPTDRSGESMARGSSTGAWRTGEERDGYRFAMASRIVDTTGRLTGALAAEIVVGPFIDAVFELQGISEAAYLLDRTGRLVRRMAYLDFDFLSGTDLSATDAVKTAVAGGAVLGDGADPLTGVASLLSSTTAQDRTGVFGSDLRIGWIVIAAEPLERLYAQLDSNAGVLRAMRLALVAGIMIFAALLTLSLRRVVRQRFALQAANVALEDASRELAAATRHKSEFLANMSHELRTPLNAIIGFSDVLAQKLFGDLNAKQTEYVGDISGSGRHLLDLVNEILDLSKVEAGRMELEQGDFSFAETIRMALTFIRERAASHGIRLSAELPADLGIAHADERKIRQVLLNLLSNAVKFTPAGGTIHVAARREHDELTVAVSDTGVGIAFEDQLTVFEEFRQVGTPSERSREGTGLGLTLAKRFVELHGGRIWLESAVGKGTTFTFTIPAGTSVPVAMAVRD